MVPMHEGKPVHAAAWWVLGSWWELRRALPSVAELVEVSRVTEVEAARAIAAFAAEHVEVLPWEEVREVVVAAKEVLATDALRGGAPQLVEVRGKG
jgi:hypothetical protein